MLNLVRSLLFAALAFVETRHQLAVEILARRHQLGVLKRSVKRPRLTNANRGLWVLLSRRWESAPRYLLRDRDGIYGKHFRGRVRNLGIEEVVIARRSPWQSPYVERVIGTLRRELVDHVIVINGRHLRRLLRGYVSEYYHPCRTHLSLGKDAPEPRAVEPPERGRVVELPVVGGLHHRYARRAA